jgi:hypothetical protein
MEIDEEWQTGRGYMKMPEEDHKKDMDDTLLREIEQIKEGTETSEELVAS